MNKWEREFVGKLEKKPMTEKAFGKISRTYDHKHHDKTRIAMNDIHDTVKTITTVSDMVKGSAVTLQVQCPIKHEISKKWSRAEYFEELKTGPMSDARFEFIMKNIGSDNTRKYYKEWNKQREVANAIWSKVNCSEMRKTTKAV
jgi:hypothetical protein